MHDALPSALALRSPAIPAQASISAVAVLELYTADDDEFGELVGNLGPGKPLLIAESSDFSITLSQGEVALVDKQSFIGAIELLDSRLNLQICPHISGWTY